MSAPTLSTRPSPPQLTKGLCARAFPLSSEAFLKHRNTVDDFLWMGREGLMMTGTKCARSADSLVAQGSFD